MKDIQFADGIDTPDRLAFGLSAGQLLAVVAGAVLCYALLRSQLPSAVTAPLVLATAALAAVLGWLRLAGRPALEWAVFVMRFLGRARSGWIAFEEAGGGEAVSELGVAAMPLATPAAVPLVSDSADTGCAVVPLRRYVASSPVRRTPRRPLRVGGAHRITFFSLKGGTGRTTLAAELACLAAGSRGSGQLRVALVDLDTRSPSVGVRLGLAHAGVADFALAATNTRRARDYITEHASGAHVMLGAPGGAAGDWPLNAGVVRELLRDLDVDGFDIVIIDVAAELSALTAAALTAADDVFIVVNATPGGVQDAYRTTEQMRRLGLRHQLRFVINRARPGVDFAATMSDLSGQVIAEIPEDPAVVEAEHAQRCVSATGGPAADALHRLARRVLRELATPRPA